MDQCDLVAEPRLEILHDLRRQRDLRDQQQNLPLLLQRQSNQLLKDRRLSASGHAVKQKCRGFSGKNLLRGRVISCLLLRRQNRIFRRDRRLCIPWDAQQLRRIKICNAGLDEIVHDNLRHTGKIGTFLHRKRLMLPQHIHCGSLLGRRAECGFIRQKCCRKPHHLLCAVSEQLLALRDCQQTTLLYQRCKELLLFGIALILQQGVPFLHGICHFQHIEQILLLLRQTDADRRIKRHIALLQPELHPAGQNGTDGIIPCTERMRMKPVHEHQQFLRQNRLCIEQRRDRL